jgi:hypothetical protein
MNYPENYAWDIQDACNQGLDKDEILEMFHHSRIAILPCPRDLLEREFYVHEVIELARKGKLLQMPTSEMLLQYDASIQEVLKACEDNLLLRKPYPSELFAFKSLHDDTLQKGCTIAEMLDATRKGLVFPKPHPSDLVDNGATADELLAAASENLLSDKPATADLVRVRADRGKAIAAAKSKLLKTKLHPCDLLFNLPGEDDHKDIIEYLSSLIPTGKVPVECHVCMQNQQCTQICDSKCDHPVCVQCIVTWTLQSRTMRMGLRCPTCKGLWV